MENNILKHRMAVMNNITKSFGYESSEDLLEKAEDNDIEKAKHQDGDMHPNGKWVGRASANGGKGDWRVAKPSRGGGSSKTTSSSSSSDSKTTKVPAIKHQVDNFMYTIQTVNSNFTDESKVTVVKTDKGNWDTYYDGKRVGIVNSSVLSEKVAKEKGWLKEDDKDSKKLIGFATVSEVKGMIKMMNDFANGVDWTEENERKAKTFLRLIPQDYLSSDKNIINRMNKTLVTLKRHYPELLKSNKVDNYSNENIDNTVTHDINGTKVTVTKNSDGSYTLEANGKKVKSDDPSFFVNGTNLKPRVKAALAKEVGLETKKK